MEHICSICNEKFENHSKKANHIRWKHKSKEFLDNCVENFRNAKLKNDILKLGELGEFEVTCHNCQRNFIVTERIPTFPSKKKYFCCRSCANTRDHKHNINTRTKISIKIKEKWENPIYRDKCILNFLNNKRCSSKGEREIREFLKEKYGYKNVSAHLRIDIGLPIKKSVDITIKDRNIIVEYDGIWHFDKNIYERMGSSEKFEETIKKDEVLKTYCQTNNIRLIRIGEKYFLHNKRKSIEEIIDFIENQDTTYKTLYNSDESE